MGSELGSSWFSSRASSPVRLGPLLALLHSLLLLQWESLKPSPYVHGLYLLFRSIEVCVRVVCCNGFTLGTCRTCTQCIHSHSVLVWGMCNSYELCAFPIIINQLNPFYLCYVWSQSPPLGSTYLTCSSAAWVWTWRWWQSPVQGWPLRLVCPLPELSPGSPGHQEQL